MYFHSESGGVICDADKKLLALFENLPDDEIKSSVVDEFRERHSLISRGFQKLKGSFKTSLHDF